MTQQLSDLDFQSVSRILNLLDGVQPQEPATVAQLKAAIEGIAWKDDVVVKTTGNINLASPGNPIDGVTLVANDRLLVASQTAQTENGIYIWNGAAVPLTRSADASTFAELEGAVVTVTEGTVGAGTTWRQTQVNGVVGTNNVIWTSFGTAVAQSTETVSGISETATQAETDAGVLDNVQITPLKLKNYAGGAKRFNVVFGDGTANSYVLTHNLNTRAVQVQVYRNSGLYDTVNCDVERTSVNTVTVRFSSSVASSALAAIIQA